MTWISVLRKFVFNYDELDNFISEQQKDPNRTDWEITLLRNNCRNNLAEIFDNPEKLIITINESTGDVSINWHTDLYDKFDMLPTWYEMNNKSRLYRQIKRSMERAKTCWVYDKIFKEIKDEK